MLKSTIVKLILVNVRRKLKLQDTSLRLFEWEHLAVSHHFDKFAENRYCDQSDLMLIICHVTSHNHITTKKNGIHSMQGRTATTRHGVTRKRGTKRLKHTGKVLRNNLHLKDVC